MSSQSTYYVNGYPSLAAFIASDPDKTTLIFRRFDRLAARNLLHLQGELARIETALDAADEQDSKRGLREKQHLRNWDDFQIAAEQDATQKERLELYQSLQKTLKEYRKATLFESTLACLPRPSQKTLNAFTLKFLNGKPESPSSFPTLGGSCTNLLENKDDLVALRVPEEQDRLTKFAQDHLAVLFQTGVKDGQIGYASDHHIARFVAWVSVLLAAALLIGAIVALYAVQTPKKRLGLIATFTAMFAAGVGLLTNARRAELFAATAAYAAVLVVFVSGNLGSSACTCSNTPNG